MTDKKLKYDSHAYHLILVMSQVIESLDSSATDHDRAEELIDLINTALQWIYDMGFDPEQIYNRRTDEKAPDFRKIILKYREKLLPVVQEVREEIKGD